MEPKQMLEAVIEKAKKGGWVCPENSAFSMAEHAYDEGDGIRLVPEFCAPILFFNHAFAKKYFGEARSVGEYCHKDEIEGKHCDDWDCKRTEWIMGWKEHLQQAVLSEDPLLYYYQHL